MTCLSSKTMHKNLGLKDRRSYNKNDVREQHQKMKK